MMPTKSDVLANIADCLEVCMEDMLPNHIEREEYAVTGEPKKIVESLNFVMPDGRVFRIEAHELPKEPN